MEGRIGLGYVESGRIGLGFESLVSLSLHLLAMNEYLLPGLL